MSIFLAARAKERVVIRREVYLNLATALAGTPKNTSDLGEVKASIHKPQGRKVPDQASTVLKLGTRGTAGN